MRQAGGRGDPIAFDLESSPSTAMRYPKKAPVCALGPAPATALITGAPALLSGSAHGPLGLCHDVQFINV